MGLEEQFDKLIPIEFGGEMQEPLRTGCIVITENFAIGFVEWFSKNYLKYHDHGMNYTTKELLEIYKKTL